MKTILLILIISLSFSQVIQDPDPSTSMVMENGVDCDMCGMGIIESGNCTCWIGYATNMTLGRPPYVACGVGGSCPTQCYRYCSSSGIVVNPPDTTIWALLCPFAMLGKDKLNAFLRNYRDNFLIRNKYGRKFVIAYYDVVSTIIKNNPTLTKVIFKPLAEIMDYFVSYKKE